MMRLYWIRVSPKSRMSGILIREETPGRPLKMQTQRLELCYHKPKNAKDCWQPLEARQVGEGFFPRDFRGSVATNVLISGF